MKDRKEVLWVVGDTIEDARKLAIRLGMDSGNGIEYNLAERATFNIFGNFDSSLGIIYTLER